MALHGKDSEEEEEGEEERGKRKKAQGIPYFKMFVVPSTFAFYRVAEASIM